MSFLPEQFTHCDNCRKPLPDCVCGENQMPVCNVCGRAAIDCACDEYSYEWQLENEFIRPEKPIETRQTF